MLVSAPAMLSSVLETFPEQADMLRTHAMTAIKDGMLRVLFIHAPLQNGKPNTDASTMADVRLPKVVKMSIATL